MKIIKESFELLTKESEIDILKKIEYAGRICYKSEDKITDESAIKFCQTLFDRKHFAMFEHAQLSVKFVVDRGCCYDDQTKVLTIDGWKFFSELTENDVYYTLDDENNIEKISAKKIIKKYYNGKMHNWKSKQINLNVTPNHNMWVLDCANALNTKWDFIKSEDANSQKYKFNKSANKINNIHNKKFTIPNITIKHGFYDKKYPEMKLDSNYFFELLGWWLMDGSISLGKNGGGNRITISQIKENGRERIKFLIEKLNLNYYEDKKGYRINSPQLFKWLKENFIKNNDMRKTYYLKLPRWIFNLSHQNIKNLLNGIIGGDGTKHTDGPGFQIYTASQKFAEDIVELSLLIGQCANIYDVKERERIFPNNKTSKCKKQYVVSVITKKEVLFSTDTNTTEKIELDYDGFVYCVELPKYHKLYVLRDGKPCWCGNSHELVRHRIAAYAQESTRYCNYSKDKFGNELSIIDVGPHFKNSESFNVWFNACKVSEEAYFKLIELGETPQIARAILPTCLKTEIVCTYNIREWIHFFNLRALGTTGTPHPQMLEVTIPLLKYFAEIYPNIFGQQAKELKC